MKWFFAINDEAPAFGAYVEMLKVAVHTAKAKTRLIPYCVYDGSNSHLLRWFDKNGVQVVRLRSRFYGALLDQTKRLGIPYIHTIGSGTFLRVEIPTLKGIFSPGEFILYTDCDVMFEKDPVDLLQEMKPPFFACAPEFRPDDWSGFNSGVMLMNVDTLRDDFAKFEAYINPLMGIWHTCSWDQRAYNVFYKDRWTRLDPFFNWKPYWGCHPSSIIVHFHGPKPGKLDFYSEGKDDGVGYLAIRGYKDYSVRWKNILRDVLTNNP